MTRPVGAALALVLIVVGGGCGGEDDQGIAQTPARTNTQTTDTSPREEGSQVRVVLAEQNGSGISGTATLSRAGGTTTTIHVELERRSGPHPAHIHVGTCDELDPTPKVPLEEVRGGRSTTDADIDLQTLLAETHAINVHRSPQRLEDYVACGEIRASQG